MRRVFYTLLLMVAAFGLQTTATAQSLSATRTGPQPPRAISPPAAAVACPGLDIMVDQTANPSGSGLISSEFTDDPTFEAMTADDFTITAELQMTGVEFSGFSSSGVPTFDSYDINIFADAGGLPGALIFTENFTQDAAGTSPVSENGGRFYFPTPPTLQPGTYWIGIQTKGIGRWNWSYNDSAQPTLGANVALINPGGGFGLGTDWFDITPFVPTSGMNFVLDFCPAPVAVPAVAPIPTMSEWGLMIFGLLILNLSVFFVYKRQNVIG